MGVHFSAVKHYHLINHLGPPFTFCIQMANGGMLGICWKQIHKIVVRTLVNLLWNNSVMMMVIFVMSILT